MAKKKLSWQETLNWQAALARYREERAAEPRFYYGELADRGRSLAELRPLLENFLQNRTNLADFTRQLARQSRQEVSASRGRQTSRYWRFHSAGRLFLESFFKQSGQTGRLNAASLALQNMLVAPATLDAAGQRLEAFSQFLSELNNELPRSEELKPGLALYLASYFWAVQQPEWPVYERVAREQLERSGSLNRDLPDSGLAAQYSSFYLAYTRLAGELEIYNHWELESFLHWLARRDLAAGRLLRSQAPAGSSPSRGSTRRLRSRTEELASLIGPELKSQLGIVFLPTVNESGRLLFAETDRPFRLELRAGQDGALRAGANFDGFNPASLATAAGEVALLDLQGFLNTRPEYRFYDASFAEKALPEIKDLEDEFWLLRSLAAQRGNIMVESLVSEWRLLYPFACRLSAPFSEEPAFETIREVTPEIVSREESFEYAESGDTLRAVADEPAVYSVAEPGASEALDSPYASPAPASHRDEAANEEVWRIDRIKPKPLSPDQLEALTVYIKDRLLISNEKIAELVTHLEAGRSLLLYGPPGSGKTRLARLLAGQMCSIDPGWATENEATNYTLATATAEWSQYDTIGGIRPGLAGEGDGKGLFYYFEPGVVARAAAACEESLRRTARPHFLIIDEFNRANQDRAFGELFTLLEYRDRPLLPAARMGRIADLYIPDAFRIIGTLNADDRNTLYEMGLALRRRFALVEIGLPDPLEERRFLPKAVKARLASIELSSNGDFTDPALTSAADKLALFIRAVRPDRENPASGGKEVGTAPLIESLLFCAVAATYYNDPTEALEDAIMANILPQLEGASQAIKRALTAVSPSEPLAEMERLRAALQRMTGLF
ncbi:MAG TPA: AAA family ATPase [Chloroflexia bacterium]|nr:AAA family ATPase [Chloroflexia bacterium]